MHESFAMVSRCGWALRGFDAAVSTFDESWNLLWLFLTVDEA